ncbi:MAG: response regulator [Methylobacterium frigidaeris]
MSDDLLSGRRVLLVEDEYFLARELDRAFRAAGAVVLGPVPSIEAALDLLQGDAAPDAAVLDVNLGGELVLPVADVLAARGVPFLFTTGYDRTTLPARHLSVRRLEKPVEMSVTIEEVSRLLRAT